MSKPFDATMRELFEMDPMAWLRFLQIPLAESDRVRVIDSNLSTVTAEADRVLWVDGPKPWIEHIELQAGRDLELPDRVHWYSTIMGRARKVPVHSTIVLLRPVADGPELSGTFEKQDRHGDVYDWFRYDVVRVWQRPVEEILAAGLPVLPLAPVSDVAPDRLAEVLTAMAQRLKAEATLERMQHLWAATEVLMGLRYPREQIGEIIEGVATMVLGIRGIEESWVYQDIFAKGRAEGRAEGAIEEDRSILLDLGRARLGPPDERVEAQVAAITDRERLHSLLRRLLDVSTWDELLSSLNQ